MASQNDNGLRTFLASPSISAYQVVDVNADGTIAAAANGSQGIGVLQEDAPLGFYGRVKLWTGPGTFLAAVSGTAITPGNVYGVITGGYIGVVATAPAGITAVKALFAGVNSPGIVLEFAGLL